MSLKGPDIICVNKELLRVRCESLQLLDGDEMIKMFSAMLAFWHSSIAEKIKLNGRNMILKEEAGQRKALLFLNSIAMWSDFPAFW